MKYSVLFLLACIACAREQRDQAGAPAQDSAAAPVTAVRPDTLQDMLQERAAETLRPSVSGPDSVTLARFRARVPDSLFVRKGGCPFECCMYGRWTTPVAVDAYLLPRSTEDPQFTIPAGTKFSAESGNVYITGVLLVAVAKPAGDPVRFQPGDTLVVLDHVGEGHFNVWHDGKVVETEGFWGAEQPKPVAEMIGQWGSEWWVRARLDDDRIGWFKHPPQYFNGSDKCAGPEA